MQGGTFGKASYDSPLSMKHATAKDLVVSFTADCFEGFSLRMGLNMKESLIVIDVSARSRWYWSSNQLSKMGKLQANRLQQLWAMLHNLCRVTLHTGLDIMMCGGSPVVQGHNDIYASKIYDIQICTGSAGHNINVSMASLQAMLMKLCMSITACHNCR